MQELDRYRRWFDKRSLQSMGRTGFRPRAYDVEVRSDAATLDVVRLPVDVNSVGSIQTATGQFVFLAGISDVAGSDPI